MSILWTIIIGFVVGLVARALMPGRDPAGFIVTTLLGVGGALLGTWIGRAMGMYNTGAGEGAGFIMSVIGAMLLLFIYGMVARPRVTA